MQDSLLKKIWNVLYPLLGYFLLDLIIVWAVEVLLLSFMDNTDLEKLSMIPALASIVFLVLSIIMCYLMYKRDYNAWSVYVFRKPWYFLVILLMGALASHGLSAFVSAMNIDGIIGNYTKIEGTIYAASPILVIIQTVILAPISEELLFRGLIYKRIEKYCGGYWIPALISSAVFGIYHFNLAQGVFAFLFGMLAAAVYNKLQNLWAVCTLHIGGNLLAVIMVYTGFTYNSVIVYVTVMLLCLLGAFALYNIFIRPAGKTVKNEIH